MSTIVSIARKCLCLLDKDLLEKASSAIGLGSDKSGLINIIQSCYKACENLFTEAYVEDGKKSVIHDITGAGLHKELATGNKFLLMHEADSNLNKLGFYQSGQPGAISNRSLLCEAFDGFTESSKTTGMYDFSIKNSRLSLLGASTGGSLHLLLARYSLYKISDGCDNRFLYHFVENNLVSYDLIKKSDRFLPSMQQIFVVVHLIGKILYSFVDALGNDESQRFYATKGKYYIAEGQRLFRDRQQAHLQSFYSKSAEIFPRICVNMQRFLDAMFILFEMRKNEDLQFMQNIDQTFVTKAKLYIDKHLVCNKRSNGDIISYVALETCHTTANLFDNYLFKNSLNLFNIDHSLNQNSIPSTQFRTLVAEKPSLEKRILQLPYQFFLRSDLKQPTTDENGKRINAPFHHVDNILLNDTLDKLVDQKLLSIGYFISRPRAQQTRSFMKNPIPIEPMKKEEFIKHLESHKINIDEYQSLLTRLNMPVNCTLLPDAKQLLINSAEHRDDCIKYGLVSTVNVHDMHGSYAINPLNFNNIPDTTDGNLLPIAVTTNDEYHETDQLINVNDVDNVLLNKHEEAISISSTNVLLNPVHELNILSHNHEELLENELDMTQVEQVQASELNENEKKTPDAVPKDCTHNSEAIDRQSAQSNNVIALETVQTTPSNIHLPEVKACVRAILQYPSMILTSSDIALATRHYTAAVRTSSIQSMIQKQLLSEDDYFVRKLSKSLKLTKGFAKKVPHVNDEQSRFDFIAILNEFAISWDLFKSFFNLTKNGFYTTTQLFLNETAELLLDSEDYRPYIIYDKCAVFHPVENEPIVEEDALEYGENITGIEPFEAIGKENTKRKTSQATSQSKRKKR